MTPKRTNLTGFRWIPQQGPSESAIRALQQHSGSKPAEAPGEAWFMSEKRRFYTNLIAKAPSELDDSEVINFLFDVSSGALSFAGLDDEIASWRAWFLYLLPELLSRSSSEYGFHFMYEATITSFLIFFPPTAHSASEPFIEAALLTLGQALMSDEFWSTPTEFTATQLQHWKNAPEDFGRFALAASGVLSASLMYCLCYMPTELVADWAKSVLAIESPHFRAHLAAWFVGANLRAQAGNLFCELESPMVDIDWRNAFLLDANQLKYLDPTTFATPTFNENFRQFRSKFAETVQVGGLHSWLATALALPEICDAFDVYGVLPLLKSQMQLS